MVERQQPNPLHYPDQNIPDHVRSLKQQAYFPGEEHQIEDWSPSKELSMSARFGTRLENYTAIAHGLFGPMVDLDRLTEEQKAKIEAVDRGVERGLEKGLEEFFKERGKAKE